MGLTASWPSTRSYHDLYTQDLASSLAQSPMGDAYRIDVLTWELADHPEFKAALEGLVYTRRAKPKVWEVYLSELNPVATFHPQADLESTWVPPPQHPLGNHPLPFDKCHIDTTLVPFLLHHAIKTPAINKQPVTTPSTIPAITPPLRPRMASKVEVQPLGSAIPSGVVDEATEGSGMEWTIVTARK
ncbi:hypothetical protein L198_07405 [Cryptococcus wingfieldii CBS 7118]|uniref:Uncharacterized protein n=1 Tax=Cryptococcus wingfieldii CBS 7118 TaxID=1295528 RepID=A0A1E3IBY5_9TREE|nr:hypothetical protein L198_07405 [Cryptococcus wingfieldii CBS 7118]ODN86112.1 hypothetical protein L198_07405 [Cryptococcus wingfieldii CBS 7118]